MAKNTKPTIRFKGFTDAWEQRKLGEVGKARSGVGFPDAEQGGSVGVPFFKVSDMNWDGNENEMIIANNYVTVAQILAHRWSPIEELPAIFFAKVGAAVMLNRKRLCRFPFLLDNNTMAYSIPSINWNADFAKALFETVDLTSLVQIGALPSYNASDVEDITICLPNLSEQMKIGAYFKQIDNLITLHQRKYDSLVNVKKAMLEKMFPKNGETVPEIRFKGFTDAWEQRKLSGIYQNIGNAFVGTATPYYVEDGHFYLESNNIKDGQINRNSEIFINDEFYEKQKDKWLHTGDMVMVQSGHVGHAAVIPEELDNSAAHALIMFRNQKEKVNPYFLNYQYQTNKAKKKIEGITTGNTIKHILASDMQEFVVDVPDFEEQEIIGAYFQQLDNLITLHQRKLEKLKNIKKSCLEKMFV